MDFESLKWLDSRGRFPIVGQHVAFAFRVWGLGFRVSGLGFRVWGLGFRV